MNVSGDFLCISETSDGIGISCIVAVKEEWNLEDCLDMPRLCR